MHRIFIPITRRVLSLFLDIISLTLFKSDDEQRTMIIRKLLKKKKKWDILNYNNSGRCN